MNGSSEFPAVPSVGAPQAHRIPGEADDIGTSSKDSVKRCFDEHASEWATCYSAGEPRTSSAKTLMARRRFAVQMVEAALPSGSTILDAGCGPGEMAATLMQRGYEVWGLDIADAMIGRARERCGVDRFRVGDIERIPFPDNTFDGVVCLGVLEYLDTDAKALREIERVLKPGGMAVVSTPNAICPLYQMDRIIAAAESLYAFAKHRLRGKPVPARPANFGVDRRHKYHRGSWLRLLRSVCLEPEERLCYGWGWYNSRVGTFVELLSWSAERFGRILERFLGRTLLHRAGDALARRRALNWVAYEQLVRLRAAK
jgi:ubiquinone/menaquinone biosynthesis C-methylase UbiE